MKSDNYLGKIHDAERLKYKRGKKSAENANVLYVKRIAKFPKWGMASSREKPFVNFSGKLRNVNNLTQL